MKTTKIKNNAHTTLLANTNGMDLNLHNVIKIEEWTNTIKTRLGSVKTTGIYTLQDSRSIGFA